MSNIATNTNTNTNIADICSFKSETCLNFAKVNDLVIQMVNDYYFDLQMLANFVFDIDNDIEPLSDNNNFYSRIKQVQQKYKNEYPDMPLFTQQNMEKLYNNVRQILQKIDANNISTKKYLSNINKIEFFGSGALSSTILLKMYRRMPSNPDKIIPLIVKLIPFEYPQHYKYIQLKNIEKNKFITEYIESPGYALFIKEAWMYCFSKNELVKYTPTFTCIENCYIIDGLPVNNIKYLSEIYNVFKNKKISQGKNLPYKKWFDTLLNPKSSLQLRKDIFNSKYGCFEMRQIEGTLDDLTNIPQSYNLSLVFEYLYTKVVTAFIAKIIFTDDHLGNVAYITVDHARAYTIKCNGCNYLFVMPPGRMIQFIDLERYVFNYSRYDIYTNTALRNIPDYDFNSMSNLNRVSTIRSSYTKNNYAFDKGIDTLLTNTSVKNSFVNTTEYGIMTEILGSPFVHDIKTFCQIMEYNLPKKYLCRIPNVQTYEYMLDLDDDSLRVITNVV